MAKKIERGRSYTHDDVHHLLHNKFDGRIIHHAPAKSFSHLSRDNMTGFILIMQMIVQDFPSAIGFCFGSRVRGDWKEGSDFDLIISGVTHEEITLINQIDFGVRVNAFHAASEKSALLTWQPFKIPDRLYDNL